MMTESAEGLITEALKSYNNDKNFLNIMLEHNRSKYPNSGAGEGFGSELFSRTINLLNQATELDKDNWQIYLLLYRVFKDKSFLGNGHWDENLLVSSSEAFEKYIQLRISNTSVDDMQSESTTLLSSTEKYYHLLLQRLIEGTGTTKIDSMYSLSNFLDVVDEPSKIQILMTFVNLLKEIDDDIRYNSSKLLVNSSPLPQSVEESLISLLNYGGNPKTKINAVWILGKHKSVKCVEHVYKLLHTQEFEFLQVAATAIGRIGSKDSIPELIQLALKGDKLLTKRAIWSLGELCATEAVNEILSFTKHESYRVYCEAFRALLKIGKTNITTISPKLVTAYSFINQNLLSLIQSRPVLGASRFYISSWATLPNNQVVIDFGDGHIIGYAIFELTDIQENPVKLLMEKI